MSEIKLNTQMNTQTNVLTDNSIRIREIYYKPEHNYVAWKSSCRKAFRS